MIPKISDVPWIIVIETLVPRGTWLIMFVDTTNTKNLINAISLVVTNPSFVLLT